MNNTKNYTHEFSFTVKYLAINDSALRNAFRNLMKDNNFKHCLKAQLSKQSELTGKDLTKSQMELSVAGVSPKGNALKPDNKPSQFNEYHVTFKCQVK